MSRIFEKKPHYTLAELARILSVSYSTAKRMVCEGVVKRVQLRANGRKVIPHAEVERILNKLGVSS